MNRVRALHNRLWVRQKSFLFRPFLMAITGYASWLMASFLNFVISMLSCVMLLGGLHYWLDRYYVKTAQTAAPGPAIRAVEEVFAYFVGSNGLTDKQHWGLSLILGFAAILGLAHLAIFLSFLYSIISRKS